MAFVQDDPNAPQNILNPPQGPMAQPPQTSSGMGGGASTASAPGSPQGVSSIPTSSKAPPVANLGDYLRANAPQAQTMADQITGKLNTGLTTVQNDLATGKNTFEGKVNAGTVAPDPGLVSRAAASPTDFVMNADDLAAFEKQMNASYTGPQDFTTSDVYSQLSGEVQKAAENAPNPNNPDDLRSTVAGLETNPTPGMTDLDTLLLQGTPGAAPKINAARAPYGSLKQSLTDLSTQQDANAANARALTATTAPAAAAPFTGPGGVVPSFTQSVTDRLAQAQQGTNAYNQEVQAYIQTLNELQSHLAPYESATGAPLEWAPKAINPITTAPTLENVATPKDFSMQAALEMLLGSGYSTPPLNSSLAANAGTFKVPDASTPTMSDMAKELFLPLGKEANRDYFGAAGDNLTAAQLELIRYLNQFDPADYWINTYPDGRPYQWQI